MFALTSLTRLLLSRQSLCLLIISAVVARSCICWGSSTHYNQCPDWMMRRRSVGGGAYIVVSREFNISWSTAPASRAMFEVCMPYGPDRQSDSGRVVILVEAK